MTNLLVKWWARLEVILTKERQNPFDVRCFPSLQPAASSFQLLTVFQNDFGRLNFEKEVINQPITSQEEVLLMNCRTMFPSLATTKHICLSISIQCYSPPVDSA